MDGLVLEELTPLLTHWSYVFLAPTHRYGIQHCSDKGRENGLYNNGTTLVINDEIYNEPEPWKLSNSNFFYLSRVALCASSGNRAIICPKLPDLLKVE